MKRTVNLKSGIDILSQRPWKQVKAAAGQARPLLIPAFPVTVANLAPLIISTLTGHYFIWQKKTAKALWWRVRRPAVSGHRSGPGGVGAAGSEPAGGWPGRYRTLTPGLGPGFHDNIPPCLPTDHHPAAYHRLYNPLPLTGPQLT